MLRNFDATVLKEYEIPAGVKTSCLIPVMPGHLLDLDARCEVSMDLNGVTEDGQSILMESGRMIKWKGKINGLAAVELVSDQTLWYRALLSRTDEKVDPTPVSIELKQTDQDVIRAMIDDRLRAWQNAQNINRELTEEEKDDLILDLVHGDLEFEEKPDEYGLGYEERLAEFTRRRAEQSNPEGVPNSEVAAPPPPPAEGSNSSST